MNLSKLQKWKTILSIIFVSILLLVSIFILIDMKDVIIRAYQDQTMEYIQEYFLDLGFWGMAFLTLFQALTILFTVVPIAPLQIITGICYNHLTSFIICFIGAVLGNFLIYLLIRKIGNAFLSLFKKKDMETVEKLTNKKLDRRFILIIFITYLIPGLPYGLIAYLATKTSLKFPRYFLITTVGIIPSIIIALFISTAVLASSIWGVVLMMLAFIVIAFLAVKYSPKIFDYFTRDCKTENANE